MELLFAKVVALGLASAISPGIFAASILLLTDKKEPMRKLAAFLAGGIAIAAVLAFAAYSVFSDYAPGQARGSGHGMLKAALGAVMVALGVYAFFAPRKKHDLRLPQSLPVLFFTGSLLYLVNFKSVLLNLAAMQQIAESDAALASRAACAALAAGLFVLPSLLPLLTYAFARKRAQAILAPIRACLEMHGAVIFAVICIGFGLLLLGGN